MNFICIINFRLQSPVSFEMYIYIMIGRSKDRSMGLLKLVTSTVIFMGVAVPRSTTPASTSTSATANPRYISELA